MNTHDARIREVILPVLRHRCPPEGLLVQEWSIPNACADLGLINDDLVEAFEIKSAADSVTRLGRQVPAYDRCFERCTLITERSHLRHAEKTLPDHWGIWLVDGDTWHVHRRSRINPAAQLAELLWSGEVAKLVRDLGLYKAALAIETQDKKDQHASHLAYLATLGVTSPYTEAAKPRRASKWSMLAVVPRTHAVKRQIRRLLLARTDWRTPTGHSQRGLQIRTARMAVER